MQAKIVGKEVDMSISSIGMSYTQLQQTSEMTVKGHNNSASEEKPDTAIKSYSSMDSVSLSAEASQSYAIGNETVSKSEFDQYDTDGNGEISSSEQAAYEADQAGAADEDDSDKALIESMQDSAEEEPADVYSPYGNMSIRGESGQAVNATA